MPELTNSIDYQLEMLLSKPRQIGCPDLQSQAIKLLMQKGEQ